MELSDRDAGQPPGAGSLKDDQKLSTVLEPMDSTFSRAHALINRPSCALVTAERRH